MEDKRIIELYFARDESAILHTKEKYGAYCYKIAYNILRNNEDSDECVNDTYLGAWNSIPPNIPNILSVYLAKITRQLSISRLRRNTAKKRNNNNTPFDELNDCLSKNLNIYDNIEAEELKNIITAFLQKQSASERNIFICRYFYCDTISEICKRFHYSQSKVKTTLYRSRSKLKEYLMKEGVLNE